MAKRYGMKEGAERRSRVKRRKPSPYMESVYHRLGSARVGYGQELPLNKDLRKGELKGKLGAR